jgi:predicted NAD/FAD-dependent oxidoreductase
LKSWQDAGVAAHWFDGFPSPTNEKPNDHHPRFRGANGMTSIAKHLAAGLNVQLGEEIESLKRENGVWSALSNRENFHSRQIIAHRARAAGVAIVRFERRIAAAKCARNAGSLRYEPCFAILCILRGPSAIPAPGLFYVNGDPVWWIADNFQKGVSKRAGAVTIHSSGAFARAHYDDDFDNVARVLIDESQAWLGSEVESYEVRRWRYSKPENPLEIGALPVPELDLCFAGDALNGAKIEGAFMSGIEAAKHLS